jgi:hypothetical protein
VPPRRLDDVIELDAKHDRDVLQVAHRRVVELTAFHATKRRYGQPDRSGELVLSHSGVASESGDSR